MGKLERLIAALAALVTIPTFGFFVYDRFWGSGATPAMTAPQQPAATPATADAPPAHAQASPPPATPASVQTAASAVPAPAPAAAKPVEKKLVFLCSGKQTPTFTPGRNPNPAMERFRNVPESAEAIFDFSNSKKSGAADVLIGGKSLEWSAYSVAVELAGAWGRYGAEGENTQGKGVTFRERGEVNFDTLEWTSDRVIKTAMPRGPQAEIKVAGKCQPLDSPKPKASDAPPVWEIKPVMAAQK